MAEPELVPGPPDFIGVGTQRSGTTWWQRLLRDHPAIRLPRNKKKEQHFFDKFGRRPMKPEDIARYHDLFPRAPGELSGEWTPRYMRDIWGPRVLSQAAPDAKLLVMFRDPVERYRSGVLHTAAREPGRVTTLLATDAVDRGRYAAAAEAAVRLLRRGAGPRHAVRAVRPGPDAALPAHARVHRRAQRRPRARGPHAHARHRHQVAQGADLGGPPLRARARAGGRRRGAARGLPGARRDAVEELRAPGGRQAGERSARAARGARKGSVPAGLRRRRHGQRGLRVVAQAAARAPGGEAAGGRPQPRVLRHLLHARDDRRRHRRLPRPLPAQRPSGHRRVDARLHPPGVDADAAPARGA